MSEREPLYTDDDLEDIIVNVREGYSLLANLNKMRAAYEARIAELEANQWTPVEDNEYDTGDDFNPLYIFGNTNYDVCTNVEYANESVTLDMGMAVCRRKG
jgi:hypothetical protein